MLSSSAEEIVQVFQEAGQIRVRVLALPDDPAQVGVLIVDALRAIAEVYRRGDGATTAEPYLDRIIEGVEGELECPTADVSDQS